MTSDWLKSVQNAFKMLSKFQFLISWYVAFHHDFWLVDIYSMCEKGCVPNVAHMGKLSSTLDSTMSSWPWNYEFQKFFIKILNPALSKCLKLINTFSPQWAFDCSGTLGCPRCSECSLAAPELCHHHHNHQHFAIIIKMNLRIFKMFWI